LTADSLSGYKNKEFSELLDLDRMMNMKRKNKHLKLTVVALAVLNSMPAFSVQDVYEYKNKEGVTEFTDQVQDNKQLEKHIQIPKRTSEQEAQSKEKLDNIIEKDKELDKKLANDRKLENERLRLDAQARADKKQSESESDNDDDGRRNSNVDWYYPPVRPRPVHPIVRPKPKHPVNKPAKPVHLPSGKFK